VASSVATAPFSLQKSSPNLESSEFSDNASINWSIVMSVSEVFILLSCKHCHQLNIPIRAQSVRSEAGAIGKEDFFKGPDFIGLKGRCRQLFPGIPGFGIPDPEGQKVAVPVDEFVGLGGFLGGVKATEPEFLNLLHIVSITFR
jgi:hypothetical protein